jgi:hypothetical protein
VALQMGELSKICTTKKTLVLHSSLSALSGMGKQIILLRVLQAFVTVVLGQSINVMIHHQLLIKVVTGRRQATLSATFLPAPRH